MGKNRKEMTLEELFNKDAELVEKALRLMSEAVIAACQHDKDLSRKTIERTIQVEKEQDRIRDEIFKRLYSKETMVFSREDRLSIVYQLNRIVSKAERVARRLTLHLPHQVEEILASITLIAKEISAIGTLLKELIGAILEDFQSAKKIIRKINDLRRDVRRKEYEALRILYKRGDDVPTKQDFIFWEDLITNVAQVANYGDQIADKMYALISKYTF